MNTRTHAARIANARIAKARARAHETFIGGRRGCRYACCAGAARRQRAVRSASTPGASQAHAQAPSTAPHSTAVCTHRHVHPERVRGKFIYSRRAEGGAKYLSVVCSGSGSGSRTWDLAHTAHSASCDAWPLAPRAPAPPGATGTASPCPPLGPHLRGARVRLPVACAVHGTVAASTQWHWQSTCACACRVAMRMPVASRRVASAGPALGLASSLRACDRLERDLLPLSFSSLNARLSKKSYYDLRKLRTTVKRIQSTQHRTITFTTSTHETYEDKNHNSGERPTGVP